MTCEDIQAGDILERYLQGRLEEPDRELFELHYLKCQDCFKLLQDTRMLQGELKAFSTEGDTKRKARRGWIGGLLAAAVFVPLLVVFVFQDNHEPTGSVLAEDLAAINPPHYGPNNLRGNLTEAHQRFQSAMEHYLNGDYTRALSGLQAAAVLDSNALDIRFFKAACEQIGGDSESAMVGYRFIIDQGDSPFLEEAHFFLAKSYLKLGRLEAARNELQILISIDGDMADEAIDLVSRLDDSMTRGE